MKKSLTLTLGLTLALSSSVNANTRMGELVDYIQNKYVTQFKDHPILVLKKDELNFRLAKKRLFGKENEKQRVSEIGNYIKEKTGVELTYNDGTNIDTYVSILKNSAVALPLVESYTSKKRKICVVFHADPSSNQRLESERVLALKTQEAYGNIDFDQLNHRLPFDVLKKFSIYHELGHCMDREFMPNVDPYEDSHGVHESESFAETAGLFFLAKEGIKDAGRNRAKMRTVYSRKMGQFFVDNPQNGFGNPNFRYGGIIYNLSPVLNAGQDLLDNDSNQITNSSLDSMLGTAEKIVKENALPFRAFNAIAMYFSDGEEAAIAKYEEFERDMPDFFTGIVDILKGYIKTSTKVLETAFERLPDPNNPQDSLIEINKDLLCTYLNTDNEDAFNTYLDELRADLENKNAAIEDQRKRQEDLINIHEIISNSCPLQ
ncbi:MAG: hypothetical protein EP319_15030 [Deltaproteobacteria bacterium]|nr:MAG: hypothetical protein EP319_15030 [Deltaproteobacteria bacterium]